MAVQFDVGGGKEELDDGWDSGVVVEVLLLIGGGEVVLLLAEMHCSRAEFVIWSSEESASLL